MNTGCLRYSWIKKIGIIYRRRKLRRQRRLGLSLAFRKRYRVNVKPRLNDKKMADSRLFATLEAPTGIDF